MKVPPIPADLPFRDDWLTACSRAKEERDGMTCPMERACWLPAFSDQQDRHLFHQMRAATGRKKAELRQLLFDSSLGLVLGLAQYPDPTRRGYKAKQRSVSSKFSLGKSGLSTAVDCYDPSRREPFREYALSFIRSAMKPLY